MDEIDEYDPQRTDEQDTPDDVARLADALAGVDADLEHPRADHAWSG